MHKNQLRNEQRPQISSASQTQETQSDSGVSISAPAYQLGNVNDSPGDNECDCYTNILNVIQEQVDGWGTDEDAIYSAIRSCPMRGRLKGDMYALKNLRSEMGGHDLWKAYLLIEYGSEDNFPSEINKIWDATKGMGTDEDAIMEALRDMDSSTRNTFGLGYILQKELSGDDLEQAMNLLNARDNSGDSIQGNLFGDEHAADGVHDFNITPENAVELIGAEFQGNDTDLLRNAMITLYERPGGERLMKALQDVAAARSIPLDKAMVDFEKAMRLRDEGILYYQEHHEDYDPRTDHPAPLLTADNIEFTATNAQLVFGKVVGDVFGIDAVFGSLMSPTGGMAGPGNERVIGVSDGSAVATHGAVHDAAGFLKNCFDIGPGYDYFNNEVGSDGTNPLAGQTNIRWWIEQYEAKGIDRGMFEGTWQDFLANNAYKGAAFAKDYRKLNLEQKKEALGIMCGLTTFVLGKLGMDNDDRVAKVQELMHVSSDDDKRALADYYYENDGFGSILAAGRLNRVMRPHVSDEVYDDYIRRLSGY